MTETPEFINMARIVILNSSFFLLQLAYMRHKSPRIIRHCELNQLLFIKSDGGVYGWLNGAEIRYTARSMRQYCSVGLLEKNKF